MGSHLQLSVAFELRSPLPERDGLVAALLWHGALQPSVRDSRIDFTLEVPDQAGAEGAVARRAASLLVAACHESGQGVPRIGCLIVCSETQRVAEAERLVGVAEVAEMLGVSRQRVSQLKAGSLPNPVALLASGPVWSAREVEGFASTWDRRPGRRAG